MSVRNLVVGLDGTFNEPKQIDAGRVAPTNVAKLIELLKRGQRVHYEEGVGTGMWEQVRGGIIGYGIDERILGAYRFLCQCFAEPEWRREENRIFLFGFSRGAYTARRLAGLVAHSGIPADVDDTELGFELYKGRDVASIEKLKQQKRFFDVPIEVVGVWDTVKATNDPDYHDHALGANVAAGYHAMAIDEQRRVFPVLRWNADPRVTQLWFPGVHADVGGGYHHAALSDVALEWMVWRGVDHGLDFSETKFRALSPNPGGHMHDSYSGIWKAFGRAARVIRPADRIHESVRARIADSAAKYRPKLPAKPIYWEEPYRV